MLGKAGTGVAIVVGPFLPLILIGGGAGTEGTVWFPPNPYCDFFWVAAMTEALLVVCATACRGGVELARCR